MSAHMTFMTDETPSSGVGRPTFAQWFRTRHSRAFLPMTLAPCLTVLYTVIFFNSEAISGGSVSLGHFAVATAVFLFIGTAVFYSLYWQKTRAHRYYRKVTKARYSSGHQPLERRPIRHKKFHNKS